MNQILFSTIFCLLFLAQIACGQTRPSNIEKTTIKTEDVKLDYPRLKIQAKELGKATVTGDFAQVVDFTYPKIVEAFGGKEKMIAFLKGNSQQMKSDGFELEAMTIGEIKQIAKVESQVFAIVPITMKIKSPNGKALGESSIIGISNDDGESWKFIDGIDQTKFKAKFPKAAEKIQIPVEQSPKAIEND